MGVSKDIDGGEIVPESSSAALVKADADKFFIYSSKAGKTAGGSIHILSPDTNTDKFVSSLKDQVIILGDAPDPIAAIDSSDEWCKWLTKLDPKGEFSLTMDGAKTNIVSFEFKLTAPWEMTFSSTSGALNFAFGAPPEIGSPPVARIPAPGINKEGSILACGLNPEKTPDVLKSTIGGLFDYAGIADTASFIPTKVAGLSVELDATKATKQHNAVWFNSPLDSQTTVRLQFKLDQPAEVQTVLASALPGFEIQSADVVCKKVLVAAGTEKGPGAVDTGRVTLAVKCSVKPKEGTPIKMLAGIEFRDANTMLTLQMESPGSLSGILRWLEGLISDKLDLVESILGKGEVLKNFNLRQIVVALDTAEDPKKPKLSSFRIDIEVSASLGQGSDGKPVVFLVTYSWTPDGGKLGSIQGQFWNWFDLSSDRDLSPYYEEWTELQPLTNKPATTINLVKIIPGLDIENIPESIPTDITSAYISLSQKSFGIGGAITAIEKPPGPVPLPYLGRVKIDASYTWENKAGFKLSLEVNAGLRPGASSKHQDPAILKGNLDYTSSDKTWKLKATMDGLYASTLCEFFDSSSATHVMPLIDSISVRNMELDYQYTAKVGSSFKITGQLLIAALKLDLTFEHKKDWTFTAVLKAKDEKAKLGDILVSALGDAQLELPDFLADVLFGGEAGKDSIKINVHKEPPTPGKGGSTGGSFHFIAEVTIGNLALTFAQYHGSDWSETTPSKRMVKLALTKIKSVEIPLVGDIAQPFDEMYYMWIQDSTGKNKTLPAGLTRKDIRELNTSLSDQLVPKDKVKEPKDTDVLMSAGSHFAVVIKNSSGERSCILDYDFKKPKPKPKGKGGNAEGGSLIAAAAAEDGDAKDGGDAKDDDDGSSAHAPFKKAAGPLSISNIGLKYSDKTLRIMFDATFELGPIGFSLLGFAINLKITSLDKLPGISASIQGLSAAFEKPPLTIAGIIRHGNTGSLDYYAGGLIVGFVPYEFQAAGFYGKASPPGGSDFTSVFIFARLEGPLVTLEFAEISGVTGGFGYKSDVRIPTADQVVDFPFIATKKLDGGAASALKTLEKLTSPDADGWFKPLDNSYWAAAGMKISAFEMLALNAVVVVQFGASIKLGIFAVGLVDIPNEKAPLKFAHVELGIAVVVDFDYGILKAEAQLSPNSYILHPDCHLTGGFGFYYWFDAPHADKSNVGNFVLTLGGYHQAYKIPDGYPNPPRLGISWSLGSALSITGQAYFAITPKVCMGGARIHASFSAGPIEAWFDAFADFLINYKPFHFNASAGICVGVSLNIDILFIHTHISVEIGAQLYLWGPPLAGRVHVDLWITSFDINFGDSQSDVPAIKLVPFYELVIQTGTQQQALEAAPDTERIEDVTETVKRPKNEGHVFLAQSGLMNDSEAPNREPNAQWTVRGGTFSFVVSCRMAINQAKLDAKETVTYDKREVYAKPMKLTEPMTSTLSVEFTQDGVKSDDSEWGMEPYIKSVPTGLWAKYSKTSDPSGGNNHVPELLNSKDGGVSLVMGVLLTVPPPIKSPDKLKTFNINDAQLQRLRAEKNFPPGRQSHPEWDPVAPLEGVKQWDAVHDSWKEPGWGTGDEGQAGFVSKWVEAFKWDKTLLAQLAAIPKNLEKSFKDLYVAAPLVTN